MELLAWTCRALQLDEGDPVDDKMIGYKIMELLALCGAH